MTAIGHIAAGCHSQHCPSARVTRGIGHAAMDYAAGVSPWPPGATPMAWEASHHGAPRGLQRETGACWCLRLI